MHPAVYDDAGQRTTTGTFRAADELEREATDLTQCAASPQAPRTSHPARNGTS